MDALCCFGPALVEPVHPLWGDREPLPQSLHPLWSDGQALPQPVHFLRRDCHLVPKPIHVLCLWANPKNRQAQELIAGCRSDNRQDVVYTKRIAL